MKKIVSVMLTVFLLLTALPLTAFAEDETAAPLVISENGNVLIGRPGGELLFSSIADFPPKSAWEDLCTLVREDDIQASVSGSQLAVAW